MLRWLFREIAEAFEGGRSTAPLQLMIGLAIIATLAALAVPSYTVLKHRAEDAAAQVQARNAAILLQTLAAECGGLYHRPPDCSRPPTAGELSAMSEKLTVGEVWVTDGGRQVRITVPSKTGREATFDSTAGAGVISR